MNSAVGAFVSEPSKPYLRAPNQPHSCSSRAPQPERHGVHRTLPRREGLGERLRHIREIVDELPVSEPEYGYKAVRIRPVLEA